MEDENYFDENWISSRDKKLFFVAIVAVISFVVIANIDFGFLFENSEQLKPTGNWHVVSLPHEKTNSSNITQLNNETDIVIRTRFNQTDIETWNIKIEAYY